VFCTLLKSSDMHKCGYCTIAKVYVWAKLKFNAMQVYCIAALICYTAALAPEPLCGVVDIIVTVPIVVLPCRAGSCGMEVPAQDGFRREVGGTASQGFVLVIFEGVSDECND